MDEWIFHCKILGVPKDASPEEIKSAYMAQAKLFHPDKHQDNPTAKEKFQQLQESYNYLVKNKKSYTKSESKKAASSSPSKKSKTTNDKWMYVSFFSVMIIGILIMNWPEKNPVIIHKPFQSSDQIEQVLKDARRYIYEMGSGQQDCSLLTKEHQNYSDLFASNERFANINCGNVHAYFDKKDLRKTITVISPDINNCRCQVAYLKNKPKVNTKKSSFDDDDLQ